MGLSKQAHLLTVLDAPLRDTDNSDRSLLEDPNFDKSLGLFRFIHGHNDSMLKPFRPDEVTPPYDESTLLLDGRYAFPELNTNIHHPGFFRRFLYPERDSSRSTLFVMGVDLSRVLAYGWAQMILVRDASHSITVPFPGVQGIGLRTIFPSNYEVFAYSEFACMRAFGFQDDAIFELARRANQADRPKGKVRRQIRFDSNELPDMLENPNRLRLVENSELLLDELAERVRLSRERLDRCIQGSRSDRMSS